MPNAMTRREFVGTAAALGVSLAYEPSALASTKNPNTLYHSFRPGEIWNDTAGKPIQAHGGSILAVDGKYYWYGENKEFTTGKTAIWT